MILIAIAFCTISSSAYASVFPLTKQNFHNYSVYDGVNFEGNQYYLSEVYQGFPYNNNGSRGYRFYDTALKCDILVFTNGFNFNSYSGTCTASAKIKGKIWTNVSFETLFHVDGYQGFIFNFPNSEVELLIMFLNGQVYSAWRLFE